MTSVLLADDHSFIRSGVRAVLEGTEFTIVAEVARGDAVLTAIRTHDPDICIFDVKMPGASGVECLVCMRQAGDRRPVVILTADLDDRGLSEAIRNSVNGILLKHDAAENLLSALRSVAQGEKAIPAALLHRALHISNTGGLATPLDGLAPKERAVVELVAEGRRNRAIAEELRITEGTVKVYISTIFRKLNLSSRTELVILARKHSGARRDL